MSFAVSKSYGLRLTRQHKLKNKEITILCLHRVSDESSLCWPPLPTKTFERLCQYWSKNYNVTDFRSLADNNANKKPTLILSFDDGYRDFYENAWPLLQQYGLKANMNVVTASASGGTPIWTQRLNNAFDALWEKGVNKPLVLTNGSTIRPGISKQQLYRENLKLFLFLCRFNAAERQTVLDELTEQFQIKEKETPFMSWNQIIDLHKSGVEIGSHTCTHDLLTNIEDADQLSDELRNSKKMIEQKTGSPVRVLAFPNGYTNEQINSAALDCGYEFLLGIKDALFGSDAIKQKKVLPRILVHHTGYYENLMNTENLFSRIRTFIK